MNEGQHDDPRPADEPWDPEDAAWALGCEAALPFLTDAGAPQDDGRGAQRLPHRD
ncbi:MULTISPECIES: hypothetical protein [Rubrivivax]|uniref:Uncharacterized protein n=1 Tax=Rubrivivax benzoatilyticus TaxID=316997 RepID=A0ABX0HT15_9BURK|nr:MULTISPECIES: hypothetical protein [Rubrivivax]EGJ12510.1 hypothetical protein RBXJA2T_19361 [Rubrivivax benzoatilyticus JA2 = ATCC BAA-35]MCD0421445.1 hypothetical protein [Rubrivivax sp. JA1024]NHK98196.1 hypothetical protein [Rubrivivax benzoatilyticus]NHL24029.1 hypothetical protein [Rubrivivax benzoatilyticus]